MLKENAAIHERRSALERRVAMGLDNPEQFRGQQELDIEQFIVDDEEEPTDEE